MPATNGRRNDGGADDCRFRWRAPVPFYAREPAHENGSVPGARLSGGTVREVVPAPWEPSRTGPAARNRVLPACRSGFVLRNGLGRLFGIVYILQNLNAQLNFIEAGEKDSALKLRTALLKFGVLPENAVVLSPKLAVEFVPRALPPEKAAEIRRVLEKYAAVPPEKVK